MKFSPSIEMKKLANCADGELIRFPGYGASTQFAIVGRVEDDGHRLIVKFDEDEVLYEWMQNSSQNQIVSLGTDYTIIVDPVASFEGKPDKMLGENGVLFLNSNTWLLYVKTDAKIPNRGILSFSTFGLLNLTGSPGPAFGKWQLAIGGETVPARDRKVVFSKNWADSQTQST